MGPRLVRPGSTGSPALLFVVMMLLLGAMFAVTQGSSLWVNYLWWKELGQVQTWVDLFTYSTLPVFGGTIVAWFVLLLSHSLGVRFAGGRIGDYPLYSRLTALGLLFISFVIAGATIDNWTVLRFFGSRALADVQSFHDPVFGKPVNFYLFDLPFWMDLRGYLFAVLLVTLLVYWFTARAWQLRFRFPEIGNGMAIDSSFFRLDGGLESKFLRGALALFLIAFACRFYLGRWEMVWNRHSFMVGVDYTDDHFVLPLYWLMTTVLLLGAVLIAFKRWLISAVMIGASVALLIFVPRIAGALFVKPNEISLERPYIETHISATRSAFGLAGRFNETEISTDPAATIDPTKHKLLLDNVRLWDWRPFHDTVTQMQALRPYYAFHNTDVDRYVIDGQYRQVMLTPREIDISQLPGTESSWINPHFIYTHGYGLVLAEVNKFSPEGQPVYIVQDMPPKVKSVSLKIDRPEIYYGEIQHEPVFVDTSQEEFDYPRGSDNAKVKYQGKGGFPISSPLTRMAAAIHFGDSNILLTGYLTDRSRMMIHRRIRDRLHMLAPYLEWDADPYLVITPEGRLVWMCDGYTTSDSYPYSRTAAEFDGVNYVRNSVKATVDAYDGETHLYVFDGADPFLAAYRKLFPALYEDGTKMPAVIREHARYPEQLFNAQANIYRIYHMRNPQAFYNNEDIWELAKYASGQNSEPKPVTATYVVATLPGEQKPEFLLMTTFTPLSKENLIGVMLARCDGDKLGEVVVLQLSKQQLIQGPMQINARINQDQNISKDLTLWNQQGSQVLQGQTLVLPVDHTFLYISPIYLQATQARMPQLKKVVLYSGNQLVYTDTYEQALAAMRGGPAPETVNITSEPGAPASQQTQQSSGDPRIDLIRNHMLRYKEFASQGKWAEAGRELDAIQTEVNRK